MATAFVRRPNEVNPDVVICCCAKCGTMVGASHSYILLKPVEDLHECPAAKPAMRTLDYVERADFAGLACSHCNWVSATPTIQGDTLDSIIREYDSLKDGAFASHVCSEHQKSRAAAAR